MSILAAERGHRRAHRRLQRSEVADAARAAVALHLIFVEAQDLVEAQKERIHLFSQAPKQSRAFAVDLLDRFAKLLLSRAVADRRQTVSYVWISCRLPVPGSVGTCDANRQTG